MSGFRYSAETTIKSIMEDPAFRKEGSFIFPEGSWLLDESWIVRDIPRLLPYHTAVDIGSVLRVLEYLRSEADRRQLCFDFNRSKADTAVVFFPGQAGCPFALTVSGGQLSYIASVHESFPISLFLSSRGYNAFSLNYSLSSIEGAAEDLICAVEYVMSETGSFSLGQGNFSLWGSGTGADIIQKALEIKPSLRPVCVISEYPSSVSVSPASPPQYICAGEDDDAGLLSVLETQAAELKKNNIQSVFSSFPHAGHGFGLGAGTGAEGWVNDALRFWEAEL